jgi:hypothetical protein
MNKHAHSHDRFVIRSTLGAHRPHPSCRERKRISMNGDAVASPVEAIRRDRGK